MTSSPVFPRHTPYDGSSPHFGIGLKPLALENWIEVDEHLSRYLHEKKRLMGCVPDRLWAEAFPSQAAQKEVLELLVGHLLAFFPDIYQLHGNTVSIRDCGEIDLADVSRPPLLTAALMVQEDLVLMRKTEAGWRMIAASVCFPSSWLLAEKIGKVMHDIHEPVPGFQKGSRNAVMIERIFDNLLVGQPVERFNWSVYNDDELYHDDRAGEHFPDHGEAGQDYYLRVEHQTLRKLPKSRDIVFTIRIHIDPLTALRKRCDRKILGRQFIDAISSMNDAQMAYKGFDRGREELIERIRKVSET